MKSTLKTLAAALITAFAASAAAQGDPFAGPVGTLDKTGANRGQALVASKISSNFERFAGSPENALALTNALRTGQTVQLTYPPTGTGTTPTVVTYDPPTGQMGWGNVKISLALAADQLARLGITNPTAEQLQAALNGGSVTVTNANGTTTTTQLRGVLQMRSEGMGWGEIAKVGGTKVGPVVSQLKMANTKVASIPASSGDAAKGVTTAAGAAATSPGKGKGVTTGAGTTATGAGQGSKGVTTAGGAANPNSSRGITTATGATGGGQGQGNAYGRGITSAAGGGGAQVQHGKPAHAGGGGQGLVTGGGNSASGVTNAGGNAGGQGKGQGGGHGKGKGG